MCAFVRVGLLSAVIHGSLWGREGNEGVSFISILFLLVFVLSICAFDSVRLFGAREARISTVPGVTLWFYTPLAARSAFRQKEAAPIIRFILVGRGVG